MPDVARKPANTHPEFQGNLRTALVTQKTELLGEITGAIAHQFNNIMMAITSYAELELKEATGPQKRNLEQVLSHAVRATSLVQNLLAFSRKQAISLQPLSLNSAVMEIQGLLQQLAGEHVKLTIHLDPKIHAVRADAIELQQLVLSLALNARNAMANGGELTIATEFVELDEEFLGTNDNAKPGKYVMLCVSDTGSGSATQVPISAGQGQQNMRVKLSLAVVRGIVNDVQGLVRVTASPKKGSSYKIYFPALNHEVFAENTYASPKNLPLSKTVLVVEDDDAVRIPAAEFLKMEGFKVLQAKTGPEAIRMLEQHRSPLDLLITDIVMPEMSGREVAERLKALYPDLKVLYMSGDTQKAPLPADSNSRSAMLQKPFRLNKLNEKIHDLLCNFLDDSPTNSPEGR